ncbi:MAG: hydantoinase B/oxoprolinase family protein [Actinomycetota bacterium]
MTATDPAPTINPATIEIIRNALTSAADEMNATLIRSAYTPIIYEMKDCSVALLDADHRVLGQSAGLPIFLGNLEACTLAIEAQFGREVWRPGDVWIMNDPYITGTHLHDMTVMEPIFSRDEVLLGFATSRAHWLDVGSKDPGGTIDSIDVFQEGLRLAPVKVVDGGQQVESLTQAIGRNSRFFHGAVGDLGAQIACCHTGARRLPEIFERFGTETVLTARDEIFRQSEALERAFIASIPDGDYRAEGTIDNDGIGDEPIGVRVTVTIHGENMLVDLTETDDARPGPVNCGATQAIAAARVAYKLLVDPDSPPNGGSFRTLSVEVREGSMVGAVEPFPVEWYFTPLGLLIDLVVKALSDVIPERAAAASYGDSMVIFVSGVDPETKQPWLHVEPTVGGWGAWNGSDGQDALINNVNGSLKDMPIEVLETKFPLRVRHYGYRTDSSGHGEFRGGVGVSREFELLTDATISTWFERSDTPAWGLAGGGDATGPDVVINPGTENERHALKSANVALKAGDVVRTMTGGGGGFGDPKDRDRDALRTDIATGVISEETARTVYGLED